MPPLKEAPSTNRRQEDEFDGDNVGVEVNQPERSLVPQDKIGHQRPHDYPQCQEVNASSIHLGTHHFARMEEKERLQRRLIEIEMEEDEENFSDIALKTPIFPAIMQAPLPANFEL